MIVDCCSAPNLKPYHDALEHIVGSISPITDIETIELSDSLDRILASDIVSNKSLPSWHCSAMDGYAMSQHSLTTSTRLTMVGQSFAGHPYVGNVADGECIRIMTGACLPDDCDLVVMQENVEVDENIITPLGDSNDISQWQHVRKSGSDVTEGTVLLKQGLKINPGSIGVIASLGIKSVRVYRDLKIAIFSTGDELVAPGEELGIGQIYDSNRYSVIAACQRLGYQIIDLGLIPDDPKQIKKVMIEASEIADVLITSGGVSVGEADYVKPIVEEIGQIDLWKVAIKPGKPIAIGSIGCCLFYGLPGNPVSAMVTLNLLVQPALKKLSGMQQSEPLLFSAICNSPLKKKTGRRDFQRGYARRDEDGQWQVKSTGFQGSAKITSISDGNCYIVLEENSTNIAAGDIVDIQLFDNMIR